MDRNGQKLFGNLKRRSSLAFVISTGRDVQMQFNLSVPAHFKLFLQSPQGPFESVGISEITVLFHLSVQRAVMSRNSRNGESAKNRMSKFSPNSPFSSN